MKRSVKFVNMKVLGLLILPVMCIVTVAPMPSDPITPRYQGHDRFSLESTTVSFLKSIPNVSSHFLVDDIVTARKISKIISKNRIKLGTSNNKNNTKITKSNSSTSKPLIKIENIKNKLNVSTHAKKPLNFLTTKEPIRIKISRPKNVTSKLKSTIYVKLTTPKPRTTTIKLNTSKIFIKLTTPKPSRTPTKKRIVQTSTTKASRKKPTVHRIITKWSDTPVLSEIKQAWYEPDVPYPSPNPEISSASPGISLSGLSSIAPQLTDIPSSGIPGLNPEITSYSPQYSIGDASSAIPNIVTDSPQLIASSSESNLNPISVFNLDMLSDDTRLSEDGGFPCPTVHISSSVLTPQQRQGCSDLNLVINSHIHQNTGGTRDPLINTYEANPVGDVVGESEAVEAIEEDPGVAEAGPIGSPANANIPAAAVPAAGSAGSGGTGGSGGSGGSGGGNNGGFTFPDLKPVFEAIRYLWQGLSYLLSFLRNPYLYIVPMLLFFLLGFFKVIALFPWWIPLLLLYVGIKSDTKPKEQIAFYKHVHKPVYHPDGWFWNHQTKMWQNLEDYVHKRSLSDISGRSYDVGSTSVQIWKRRKRRK